MFVLTSSSKNILQEPKILCSHCTVLACAYEMLDF